MRNTAIEDHLNRKLKPRWLGPLIVIRQSAGGSYLLAEMDSTMLHRKVAKFRVIPYFARERITYDTKLPDIIDLSEQGLKESEKSAEPEEVEPNFSEDLWFGDKRLGSKADNEDTSNEAESDASSEGELDEEDQERPLEEN